ncbi:hypothetical protein N431DRAFT_513353 [Stipitochalara longipes BDJ]|nr:hypothetical protein N431DRAFT_513353 [Stipitochalara longipes BDJ]
MASKSKEPQENGDREKHGKEAERSYDKLAPKLAESKQGPELSSRRRPSRSKGAGEPLQSYLNTGQQSGANPVLSQTENGPATTGGEVNRDFLYYDRENQHFKGPRRGSGAYASISVLDPIITIEHYNKAYHVAARFNIETTILGYDTRKRLQFPPPTFLEPESEPTAAFQVTRSSNTQVQGKAGLNLAQIPSGNVSLGITRSRNLEVQYSVNTWSLSAHQVSNETVRARPRDKMEYFKAKLRPESQGASKPWGDIGDPRYQWFWTGNQEETEILTPDIKHTVKRYIVVTRVVDDKDFPLRGEKKSSAGTSDKSFPKRELRDLLDFWFSVQVRLESLYVIINGSLLTVSSRYGSREGMGAYTVSLNSAAIKSKAAF